MKVSITFVTENKKEFTKLKKFLDEVEPMISDMTEIGGTVEETEPEETSAISIADIKAKRGKKGKKTKVEETENDEISDDDAPLDEEVDADDESEETEGEDFDETEEDESLSESDLAKLKSALKAYSAKKDKKQAIAILNKFAERSDLVKPADLAKLLKLLKA